MSPQTKKETSREHFTDRRIEALKPEVKRRSVYDLKTCELGLRIETSGAKTFFWYRTVAGKPKFKTIGTWPDISLDKAREHAQRFNTDLADWVLNGSRGTGPFKESRGELTFNQLLEDYVQKHVRTRCKKPEKAEKDVRWMFNKYLFRLAGPKGIRDFAKRRSRYSP